MTLLERGADTLQLPIIFVGIVGIVAWLILSTIVGSDLRARPRLAWTLFWLHKAFVPFVFVASALDSASKAKVVEASVLMMAAALLFLGSLLDGRAGRLLSVFGGVMAASAIICRIWIEGHRIEALALGIIMFVVLKAIAIRTKNTTTQPRGNAHA